MAKQAQKTPKIEAHGVKGLKSVAWRRVFENQAAFERWLELMDGTVEVHATREIGIEG